MISNSNISMERIILRRRPERCDCAMLPWAAVTHTDECVVGRFARRTDADLFAVERERTGWGATADVRGGRAIVVVQHGFARVVTEGDVEVVILDLDTRQSVNEQELAPVHCDYASLLARAGVAWPISEEGRRNVGQRVIVRTAVVA